VLDDNLVVLDGVARVRIAVGAGEIEDVLVKEREQAVRGLAAPLDLTD